ncbi:MAG: c-type cytochrome [Pirellulaceae bacterium]|nr:c-type cytochrome [Pirellulaceae bacterium]
MRCSGFTLVFLGTWLSLTVANSIWAGEPVALGEGDLLSGIPGSGPLTPAVIEKWLADPANHVELSPVLPLGLAAGAPEIKGIRENPLTRAKIELGRQLYFDKRLSSDNSISCASCHAPNEGYGRHTQFGEGVRGQKGGRNSPVSYNRILSDLQFWDGRAASLEEQAKGPIANPIEMSNTHDACLATVKNIRGYTLQFDKVFGPNSITIDNVAKAIATFERSIVTGPSPYDFAEALKPFKNLSEDDLEGLKEDEPKAYARYEKLLAASKLNPMSPSATRGRELFFSAKVGCSICHVGANLADEKYHNLGIGMAAAKPDLGRYEITKDEKDKGAFKTPTIRNVATSAPYMHDGSLKSLAEVVEHYAKGGTPNPWLSDKIKKIELTAQDKQDLVAFMEACTGPFPKVETARLPE